MFWVKSTLIDDYLDNFINNGKVLDPESYDREKILASFGLLGMELNLDFVEK